MVQPVLIRPIPCLQHHHGLARNDATRVTGTRSSSACLSTALSVCLYMSICLPAHLSVCLAVNQSRLMLPPVSPQSVCPSCPFVRLPIYLSTYLSACLCICPSVCLSVLLSMLSICLPVHGAYRAYHTEMPYRDWNHGAACCPVRRRVRMYQG